MNSKQTVNQAFENKITFDNLPQVIPGAEISAIREVAKLTGKPMKDLIENMQPHHDVPASLYLLRPVQHN